MIRIGANHHVLERRHVRKQADILECTRHPESRNYVRSFRRYVFISEQDSSARRLEKTGYTVEDRRPSCAIWPDECRNASRLNIEVEISYCCKSPELHSEPFQHQSLRHWSPLSPVLSL